MELKTQGIHHISVIAQHPQENVEFYTGFLGLRLVKNTLNYDDMSMYHFYYGNHNASGNVSTFFPIPSSEEGKVGQGQVAYQTYLIPNGSMDFWVNRLKDFKIPFYKMKRHNRVYLIFKDPHGYELEMLEHDEVLKSNNWEFNGVNKAVSIQSIKSAGLYSSNREETHKLLTSVLGYVEVSRDAGMILYRINDGLDGEIELRESDAEIGTRGYGTVHHIALKVGDEDIEKWYTKLIEEGYSPTEVKDRNYFKALYFRDRGGILFELSTLSPGMLVDEDEATLGERFIIPKHHIEYKEEIMKRLAPVEVKEIDGLNTYSYRNRNEYDFVMKRQSLLKQINALKSKENLNEDDHLELDNLRKAYKATREDFK